MLIPQGFSVIASVIAGVITNGFSVINSVMAINLREEINYAK